MAHTFIAYGNSGTDTANPNTVPITLTAGSTLLVVGIGTLFATGRGGGTPTFNGVDLTDSGAGLIAPGAEVTAEVWYLVDPPTGAEYTLSVPNPAAKNNTLFMWEFKAGAGMTSAIDVFNSSVTTEANPALGLTPNVNGAALVDLFMSGYTNAPTSPSHTSDFTIAYGTRSAGVQHALQASAGLLTFAWTQPSDDVARIVAAWKEVVVASNNPIPLLIAERRRRL